MSMQSGAEFDLRPLIGERITIANFSELYSHLPRKNKYQITMAGIPYQECISGKPIPFQKVISANIDRESLFSILEQGRYCINGKFQKRAVRLPLSIDEDLAYFLGIIAGDGHISKPKPHQTSWWFIQMCEDDIDFQKRIYSPLVEKLFCYSPRIAVNSRKDGRKNIYSRINSLVILLFLTRILGIKNGYKTDVVEVPACVLGARDLKIQNSYIGGLFDTDGTVTNGRVKYSTVSKKLFIQVLQILNMNGIKFRIDAWKKNSKAKTLYTVTLFRCCLRQFRDRVGFKNVRKRIKLENILAPSSSGQG